MDLSAFFDYPSSAANGGADELVLLPAWGDDDWAKLLAHTETRQFLAGEDAIGRGEVDRGLYLVAAGTVEVLVPRRGGQRPQRLAVIEAGSIVGEQAFLDGKPRSATVRAVSSARLLRLSVEAFEVFAAREPKLALDLVFDLGRILSLRLRQTTAVVSSLVG